MELVKLALAFNSLITDIHADVRLPTFVYLSIASYSSQSVVARWNQAPFPRLGRTSISTVAPIHGPLISAHSLFHPRNHL